MNKVITKENIENICPHCKYDEDMEQIYIWDDGETYIITLQCGNCKKSFDQRYTHVYLYTEYEVKNDNK